MIAHCAGGISARMGSSGMSCSSMKRAIQSSLDWNSGSASKSHATGASFILSDNNHTSLRGGRRDLGQRGRKIIEGPSRDLWPEGTLSNEGGQVVHHLDALGPRVGACVDTDDREVADDEAVGIDR